MFLSLSLLFSVDLWQVTTKGVKHIARGCPNLAVLNLYHCSKVQVCLVAPVVARACFSRLPSRLMDGFSQGCVTRCPLCLPTKAHTLTRLRCHGSTNTQTPLTPFSSDDGRGEAKIGSEKQMHQLKHAFLLLDPLFVYSAVTSAEWSSRCSE